MTALPLDAILWIHISSEVLFSSIGRTHVLLSRGCVFPTKVAFGEYRTSASESLVTGVVMIDRPARMRGGEAICVVAEDTRSVIGFPLLPPIAVASLPAMRESRWTVLRPFSILTVMPSDRMGEVWDELTISSSLVELAADKLLLFGFIIKFR